MSVLHPYYKLDYVELAWGGEREQEKERVLGNFDARNWKDDALSIFETAVSSTQRFVQAILVTASRRKSTGGGAH